MTWHVLVDLRTGQPLPAGLQAAVETHPLVAGVSVHAPAPPPAGWRKTLAAFGRTKPPSVLVAVEVAERREAERIAVAAVAEALARVGVDGTAGAAGSFRR